jgi:hypothetical protein
MNNWNAIVILHPGYKAYMTYDEVEHCLKQFVSKPGRYYHVIPSPALVLFLAIVPCWGKAWFLHCSAIKKSWRAMNFEFPSRIPISDKLHSSWAV